MKKIYSLLFLFAFYSSLFAQWNGSAATGGNVVCNATTSEQNKLSISDGSNGVIVIFESIDDNSSTPVSNLYAQRINSNGQVQWGTSDNPKPVCVTTADKFLDDIVADGSGGAFVTWSVARTSGNNDSTDLYIQHINSNGNPVGAVNGTRINAFNTREHYGARLCSDGASGAVVVWSESVFDSTILLTTYSQVFAQKYNSTVTAQWTANGVQICTAAGLRAGQSMVADGSGGAIISFGDTRNATVHSPDDKFDNIDIYAQRLNSNGALQWTGNGVAVNTRPFSQFPENEYLQTHSSVSDGAGGVILLYGDYTGDNDGPDNLYAQRLNSSGVRQWNVEGVPVCTADSDQVLIKTLSDGAGGMIAFWSDDRLGTIFGTSYYAQRILPNGTVSWTVNGVKLIDNPGGFGGSYGADITDDGNGNFIYIWTNAIYNIKAQKINSSAVVQWTAGGKDVSTMPGNFTYLGQIIKAEPGTAIINWIDYRNNATSNTDIYAAKITATGDLANGGSTSTNFITIANGNWNAPSTWMGGNVPTATSDCTVLHNVTVTANASCKSVKVQQANASITVNTGINFTVLQ